MAKKVILFDDCSLALSAKKQSSAEDEGTVLGYEFTTPIDLVGDLWRLHGDGRRIISKLERELLVLGLLGQFGLRESVSTAQAISGFIYEHPSSLQKIGMEGLSISEEKILSLCDRYFALVRERDLIEIGETFAAVSPAFKELDIDLSHLSFIEEPVRHLFEEVYPWSNGGIETKDYLGEKAFQILVPKGSAIKDRHIADALLDLVENNVFEIAIATTDVKNLYLDLNSMLGSESALQSIGIQYALFEKTGFCQTHFGRAFKCAYGLITEEASTPWICLATDFAGSPYSAIKSFRKEDLPSLKKYAGNGKSCGEAFYSKDDLNTIWRMDRTLSASDAIDDLSALSKPFNELVSIIASLDDSGISSFESVAQSRFSSLELIEEMKAIRCARDFANMLKELNVSNPSSFDLLFQSSLGIQAVTDGFFGLDPANDPVRITILPVEKMQSAIPQSYDAVVFDDVGDSVINASAKTSALGMLESDLGFTGSDDSIDRARNLFKRSQSAARKAFICVLPATDRNTKEVFSSFAFDEFLNTHFGESINKVSIQKKRFDSSLEEGFVDRVERSISMRGEEDIVSSIGRAAPEEKEILHFSKVVRGDFCGNALAPMMPQVDRSGGMKTVLSPSAIEAYMLCPYKWFTDRFLGIGNIDEGFGAAEAGQFAHSVLEDLYRSLIEAYGSSASIRDLDQDAMFSVFSKTFDRLLAQQRALNPKSGRYVPINEIEQNQVEKLKLKIWRSLLLHSDLPADFSISSLERDFNPYNIDEEAIDYAGSYIRCRIDRVDSNNGCSEFYILDYKGSLSDHEAGLNLFSIEKSNADAPRSSSNEGETLPADECGTHKEKAIELERCGRLYSIDPMEYPDRIQALVYASVESKYRKSINDPIRCVGALYTSYKAQSANPLVVGSVDSGSIGLMRLSNPESAVPSSCIDFQTFLDAVEAVAVFHIERLKEGDIPADPHSVKACRVCDNAFCLGRRK